MGPREAPAGMELEHAAMDGAGWGLWSSGVVHPRDAIWTRSIPDTFSTRRKHNATSASNAADGVAICKPIVQCCSSPGRWVGKLRVQGVRCKLDVTPANLSGQEHPLNFLFVQFIFAQT
jgi:hypothetical protein